MIQYADAEAAQEYRAREASELSGRLSDDTVDATQSVAAFVIARNPIMSDRFSGATSEAPRVCAELRRLLSGDQTAMRCLDKIETAQTRALILLSLNYEAARGGDQAPPRLQPLREELYSAVEQVISDTRVLTDEIRNARIRRRDGTLFARTALRVVLVAGGLASLILSILLSRYYTNGIVRRLSVTQDNARRVIDRRQLNPALPGTDEISDLDREFHRMAKLLEQSASREREIMDNAVDVISSIDVARRFSAVSAASLKAWGYGPSELVGSSASAVIDPRERPEAELAFARAFDNSGDYVFESRILRKDGAGIDTRWSVFSSEVEKTLFCITRDVTDRKRAERMLKESEERVRTVMQEMPVGLVIVNGVGEIDFVNRALELTTSFTAQELIGSEISQLILLNAGQTHNHFWQTLLSSKGAMLETNARRAGGDIFPAQLTAREFSAQGKRKLVVSLLDITERQEIEKRKHEFVAMVSHDLRSPLTSLRMTINAMHEGALGELSARGQQVMENADRETSRLIRMINDLLNLEKLKSGHIDLAISEAALSDIFFESAEALRGMAQRHSIAIEIEPTEAKARCDRGRIIQVAVNLLSNAIKFSPVNSAVRISALDMGEDMKVSISDCGRGVPEAHKKSIFEKFKQVHIEDATKRQGIGLGLPICKAVIEQHGGQIGVDSADGEGSTFWFTLPK